MFALGASGQWLEVDHVRLASLGVDVMLTAFRYGGHSCNKLVAQTAVTLVESSELYEAPRLNPKGRSEGGGILNCRAAIKDRIYLGPI